MALPQCRICGGRWLTSYAIREMMFGTAESFEYDECQNCGCVQKVDIPPDLSQYYPETYYAHTGNPVGRTRVQRYLRRYRNRYAFFRRGALGRLLHSVSPYYWPTVDRWIARNGLTLSSRILDVGCGHGQLLYDMSVQGFRCLQGVDPFIDADLRLSDQLQIRKGSIHDLVGSFDLIMLHHSLEHMPDQLETLRSVCRLLDEHGECLVRIPTASSYAWEHYREHWVQLDAPRHLFIHTTGSLSLLARKAGLEITHVEYDSTELQFVGSELYRRGVPLTAARGKFSSAELRKFRRQAEQLNKQGRGDSAAFWFRRIRVPEDQ